MYLITSRSNPLVKEVASLHAAKGRKEHNLFLAEGKRVIKTLLQNNAQLKHLFILEDNEEQLEWAHKNVHPHTVRIVPMHVMEKISTNKKPNGYLGVFEIQETSSNPLKPGIVLANITDPGNMGTLIRTAAAMNIGSIVIVDGCDPFAPKVVQSSAGTLLNTDLHMIDWDTLKNSTKDIPLIALVVQNGQKASNLPLKDSLLVIGNEAHGLPDEWRADCKFGLTLDMPGGTESLNAAVAGCIAMYLGWSE